MAMHNIPPSPNWYCSKVSDANRSGYYVFGARSNVFVYKTTSGPPCYAGLFTEHKDRVSSVLLGQTEESLMLCCSASDDGTVKVWDTSSRIVIKSHTEHKEKISCGSWSSLQQDLIVTGDERGNLMCWQYKTDKCQKFKQEKEYIFSVACSPHKTYQVAVGYKSGTVLLLDITKNCKVLHKLRGHDDEIHSIVWCPVPGETIFDAEEKEDGNTTGGSILATGSRDRTIRFWSSEKGRQLFLKKLPVNTGFKREQREDGRNKVWLSLCWRKEKWHQLISSSHGGDLLLWDLLPSAEKPMQMFCAAEGKCHTRIIFNICCGGPDNNMLYTISMDRLIGVWNMRTLNCVCSVPSLGGYVYTIKSSPIDPGRIALGVGDSMIRVWNKNNKSNAFDVQTLWQGIKSKVTCLSWHPGKEGWLAYGTEDGRVGIYDVFSTKAPSLSGTFHRKTVYVVAWGPPSKATVFSEENKCNLSLYTVGDGIILEHQPKSLSKEATNINKVIETVNGKKTPGNQLIRSDIAWKLDYSLVAIGNEDGSVDVYWANFKLRCVIQVHRKLINCLQWHPHITTQGGQFVSNCNSWLASGANDAMVHIVDLSDIPLDKPVTIIESMRKLDGHSIRVTGLSWSPHVDGRIASCGYDSTVIVWNVKTGAALVKYDGHQGRILGVLWSGLNPDEVMSGGFGCSLHTWSISSLPRAVIEHGAKRKKAKKKRPDEGNKKRDHKTSTGSDSNEASGGDHGGPSKNGENKETSDSDTNMATHNQFNDLKKLLDKKREELRRKDGQSNKDSNRRNSKGGEMKVEDILGTRFFHESKKEKKHLKTSEASDGSIPTTASATSTQKKKRKAKSYFPVIAHAENRGKVQTHNDLIQLTKIVCGEKNKPEAVSAEHNHLGLFTNRRAAFKCIKKEGEYHQKNDNMDYFLQMEIWKGNIRGALQIARENDELSDWLVAMAPLGSYDMWLTACEDYARQLEEDGQYHKSATYLLSCHKVYDAIELFKRHKLYKEAISLARVRLSPLEPLFEDLYTDWSQQLMKDGQYEQAAKCYVAMKKIQDAAKVLVRRTDQSSLKTAAHITLIANEKQQGMLYAQRFVNQCLGQYTWQDAYKFLDEHDSTKIFLPFVSLHELLVKELQVMTKEVLEPVNADNFSVWSDSQNSVIPDFILDESDSDPVLPWKPYLSGKHSFPHHVLRCWYGNLHLPMDTSSLSNMYKTLIHHQSGRQGLLDINQILLQVSSDLTLFLLALLLNETSAAINHMLQSVVSLHEAGQLKLMQAVCQLILPHGPKYLLKLQQEVTAVHVVISMESHINIEGASKVNTLKRLLSELKEDDNISSTGHRCRELDCLRAYYYLAIVNYLLDRDATVNKKVSTEPNQEVDSATDDLPTQGEKNVEPDICANTHVKESDLLNKNVENSSVTDTRVNSSLSEQSKTDNKTSTPSSVSDKVSSKTCQEHDVFTMSKLYDLSKGLLWDIQAKRYALTETLGYIHKAISQCLLTDKANDKSLPAQGISSHRRPDILLCSKGGQSLDSNDEDSLDKKTEDSVTKEKENWDELIMADGKQPVDGSFHHPDVEMMLANGADTTHKSRKVLWEDQPPMYVCDKHEPGTRSTSCLLNPTKYINVPDEWYSMPVDKKYFMSYVTMPVLREEQEFVTHELKRIPDSSHVPFPTTFETSKRLLKLTQICTSQDDKEVQEYREKLVKWALNFAVITKQREELGTLLTSVSKESSV